MKKVLLIATAAAVLSACASTQTGNPVIARAGGTLETTGVGASKLKAQNAALDTAKKQCGMKTPVVISDEIRYNGVLDEKTGRMIEQGASVVGILLGTPTPNLSRDDDYEYTIKFQCQ